MFNYCLEHEQKQKPSKDYDHLPGVKLIKKHIVPRTGFLRKKFSAKKVSVDSISSSNKPEESRRFSCALCPNKKFKAKRYLKAHMSNLHSDEEQTFIYCLYSGCQYRTRMVEAKRIQAKRRFKLHLKLKHSERRLALALNTAFPPHSKSKGFPCRLISCKSDTVFMKLADREKHVALRHQNFFNKTIIQNETDLACISARNRNTADQMNCPKLNRYKCNICHATGDSAHTQGNCPHNKDGKYNGEDTRMAFATKVKTTVGTLTGSLLDDAPPGDMFDMECSEDDSEDIEVLWDRKEEVEAGNKKKEVSDEDVAKILKRKENKSTEEVSKIKAAPSPVLLEQPESVKLTQLYQELQLYR